MMEQFASRFSEMGVPKIKSDAFRYFPISRFTTESFEKVHKPELTLQGNDDSIVVLPIQEAKKQYSMLLKNRWHHRLQKEKNPYAMQNGMHAGDGLFIYIPPNKSATLSLIYNVLKNGEAHPRIECFVGKEAELILSVDTEAAPGAWTNAYLEISLDQGAKANYYAADPTEKQCWHFDTVRAHLARDARFECFHMLFGSNGSRLDIEASLNGENAEVFCKGAAFLTGKNQAHQHLAINHMAPSARSSQAYKCLVADSSRNSFEGKIFVDQIAQQTEAYQLNSNLVVGEKAACFSKPNLKIFADDVKASHGSTTTDLDSESIFYLKTRGISEERARAFLTNGFMREIIDQITYLPFKNSLAQRLEKENHFA